MDGPLEGWYKLWLDAPATCSFSAFRHRWLSIQFQQYLGESGAHPSTRLPLWREWKLLKTIRFCLLAPPHPHRAPLLFVSVAAAMADSSSCVFRKNARGRNMKRRSWRRSGCRSYRGWRQVFRTPRLAPTPRPSLTISQVINDWGLVVLTNGGGGVGPYSADES